MYLFVQLLHIETGWVIKGINSESAKLQTPEFKTQSHQELSRRCASMSNWYSASGWALCSLLGILWWNHWMCQRLCMFPVPVSCAINTLVESRDIFCCDSAKLKLTLGSRIFEDISVALSDGARRTPASFISSPGYLRLQAGGIFVALAGGVVAVGLCCLLLAHCLLWWQGRGHWRGGRSKGVEALGLPDEE